MKKKTRHTSRRIEQEYYSQYGKAMAAWADIEYMLALWFAALTGLSEYMARELFASPRSFNGNKDLLHAAFYAKRRTPELTAYWKTMMERVMQYYGFRNFLAHHQTFYEVPKKRFVLKKRNDTFSRGMVLEVRDLRQSARNFRKLGKIILFSLPSMEPKPPLTPPQALARILELPPDARSRGVGRKSLQKRSRPPTHRPSKAP